MGKYDHLTILKKTKARSYHICHKCNEEILQGDYYYREFIEDKFLHKLHSKKYCSVCYEKYGQALMTSTEKGKKKRRSSPSPKVSLQSELPF
jgi:uncharacterized protein with PIN domain